MSRPAFDEAARAGLPLMNNGPQPVYLIPVTRPATGTSSCGTSSQLPIASYPMALQPVPVDRKLCQSIASCACRACGCGCLPCVHHSCPMCCTASSCLLRSRSCGPHLGLTEPRFSCSGCVLHTGAKKVLLVHLHVRACPGPARACHIQSLPGLPSAPRQGGACLRLHCFIASAPRQA